VATPGRDYRRWTLGLLAAACGAVALWSYFWGGDDYKFLTSACVRIGFILAVLCLALPDVMRGPAVLLYILAGIAAVAAMFRGGRHTLKILVPALTVLGILSFLRRFTGGPRRSGNTGGRNVKP
jgi:hypothetical protein